MRKRPGCFFALLQNAGEAPSSFFADSANRLLENAQEIFSQVVAEEIPRLPIQIALARGAIETLVIDPEENALYKVCLLSLAREIASASGGGLFGFGSKISRSERRAIESLQELLGVEEFEI